MTSEAEEIKAKVRRQFAAAGDAYVRSSGHATGSDLQRMVELAAPRPDDVVLDLATGGGHVARVFAPHVARVVATDLTPEILEHAAASFREHELTNVETALADAEQIPFLEGSFDIVTCRIAPHHFPQPAAFVTESARVLKPGGRFVLVDSTVEPGPVGEAFNVFEKLRDPSHVRSLTVAEWLDQITAAGMTVTHRETFAKTHDFADWVARSRAPREAVERFLLDADEALRQAHDVVIEDGHVRSFTDTKTLFVALRP